MQVRVLAESVAAETPDVGGAVLDLVHLSRQTLGDGALEAELLRLFDRQALQFSARLLAPSPSETPKDEARLAHTLKGSAVAVGAFAVAGAAQAFEEALLAGAGDLAPLRRRLAEAVEITRAKIAEVL
jgi:HPt (histidine-containing phosphotransfer) domain-containing protein